MSEKSRWFIYAIDDNTGEPVFIKRQKPIDEYGRLGDEYETTTLGSEAAQMYDYYSAENIINYIRSGKYTLLDDSIDPANFRIAFKRSYEDEIYDIKNFHDDINTPPIGSVKDIDLSTTAGEINPEDDPNDPPPGIGINVAESVKVRNALRLLENAGYTINKPLNEADENLVDTVKAQYDRWQELRNTPEGDDLWDEMTDTYGWELIDLVSNDYENIKAGKPVDMTEFVDRNTEYLEPKFFELLNKVGAKEFRLDLKEAFGGSAYYLYMVLAEGNVKLETDKYDSKHPEMATFIVAR